MSNLKRSIAGMHAFMSASPNYNSAGDAVRRIAPPPKRYKVGELSAATGLSRQTLHNYVQWGLIREVAWTAGGHRLFDEAVFDRLTRILALKPSHTVEEILAKLDGSAQVKAAHG